MTDEDAGYQRDAEIDPYKHLREALRTATAGALIYCDPATLAILLAERDSLAKRLPEPPKLTGERDDT